MSLKQKKTDSIRTTVFCHFSIFHLFPILISNISPKLMKINWITESKLSAAHHKNHASQPASSSSVHWLIGQHVRWTRNDESELQNRTSKGARSYFHRFQESVQSCLAWWPPLASLKRMQHRPPEDVCPKDPASRSKPVTFWWPEPSDHGSEVRQFQRCFI